MIGGLQDMEDFDRVSRVDKFEKRRKNTKSITILVAIGVILLVFLLGFWIFGGNDDKAAKDENNNGASQSEEKNSEKDGDEKADQFTRIEEKEEQSSGQNGNQEQQDKEGEASETNGEVETKQVQPSDDNVIEAYIGDWQPIGTEQTGTHTTDYNDGSQDRKEIAKAVSEVTGLQEESMVTHWVGNGGEQKVEATVSDANNSQIYRVYLTWIDERGWKPTKVEKLKQVMIN
jgi:FtsZ-interacting cell division protein ZipA